MTQTQPAIERLQRAREIVAEHGGWNPRQCEMLLAGQLDYVPGVQIALAALTEADTRVREARREERERCANVAEHAFNDRSPRSPYAEAGRIVAVTIRALKDDSHE